MRALLLTSLLLCSGVVAAAPARSVVVVRAPELSSTQKQRVLDAGTLALSQRTSFAVNPLPPAPVPHGPIETPCGTDECLVQLAREANAEFALVLDAALPELVFELRAAFVDVATGQVTSRTARGGSPENPNEAVALLLDAVLPDWARKGWASVAVAAPTDAVVKVDGRRVALAPLPQPLSLAAGAHEIDVILPGGGGVLWRRRLVEGERFTVEASAHPAVEGLGRTSSHSALRPVSYALWSAGAVAVATSLVLGGLSRGYADDLAGCRVDWRDCSRLDEARAAHRKAETFADTGNLLLIGGAALGAAGAGVFVFDLAGGSP